MNKNELIEIIEHAVHEFINTRADAGHDATVCGMEALEAIRHVDKALRLYLAAARTRATQLQNKNAKKAQQ